MNKLLIVLLSGLAGGSALAQPAVPTPVALPPGLYVSVTQGQIIVSNKGGATTFSAGQFGYTATLTQPPVIVPQNPGIKFAPPPVFNSSTPQANATPPKSTAVDCEVR